MAEESLKNEINFPDMMDLKKRGETTCPNKRLPCVDPGLEVPGVPPQEQSTNLTYPIPVKEGKILRVCPSVLWERIVLQKA
jgi:hypothetical protein